MNAERLFRNRPHLRLWLGQIASSPGLLRNPLYREMEKVLVRWKSKRYERDAPWQVHIENTNHCNARCLMCPYPTMERKKGFMSDLIYEKAIEETVALGTRRVNLQFLGEPLLDKQFIPRLQLAKKFGLEVATSTNGSTLTDSLARGMVESRLDELNVSIDGYGSQTFNRIRLGLDYEQIVDNLEGLLRIKRYFKPPLPLVFLRFTLIEENRNDVELFIRFWSGKVDGLFITQAHDWAGGVSERFRSRFHSRANPIPPCKLLWREIMILYDGTVSSCCHDFEGHNVLGNISRQSLRTIWNGESMKRIRDAHLKQQLELYPTCDQCRIRTLWWT